MGRSLKYEIPGIDRRVPLAELGEKGWAGVFGAPAGDPPRRILEIGFGRGEFLLDLATRHPEDEFLGIEVSFKRTLKMARKVARAGLANVRLVEARAEAAIALLDEPPGLQAIWINFSDPWPKGRHAHRRLVRPDFVAAAARALAPEGRLFVATDDVPYAHQIDDVLTAEPALANDFAPWAFHAEVEGRVTTGYEEQWRAEGRPLHFFAHRRAAGEIAAPPPARAPREARA